MAKILLVPYQWSSCANSRTFSQATVSPPGISRGSERPGATAQQFRRKAKSRHTEMHGHCCWHWHVYRRHCQSEVRLTYWTTTTGPRTHIKSLWSSFFYNLWYKQKKNSKNFYINGSREILELRFSKFLVVFLLTCSQAMHSSVIISNNGTAFLSFLLNISRTIDSKFHIPSGSLPRRGRRRELHSAAAGGAVVVK